MRAEDISPGEARRIALAAQDLAGPPSGREVDARAVVAAVRRLGALQMDSVNVLVRAHYLPLLARLGPYPRETLDRLAWGSGRRVLFEYWGHMCSLLPLETYPLFRWRMERAESGKGVWRFIARLSRDKPELVARVEREVRQRGPITAGELADRPRASGGWWGWSEHKAALEYLFWTGRLATAERRNFERVYDVAERVIPEKVRALPVPDVAAQQRALLTRAAAALGIGTAADLACYFQLSPVEIRPRIAELAEEGTLREARVEGWKQPAWLARGARLPRSAGAAALLSPFDSLVWDRARVQRLFGFHYRISIYTPAHLRTHGYYVLPFLLGDRLVARVDLKSDRANGALLLRSLHFEPGIRRREVMPRLREKLLEMARWLGLDRVLERT
ncbi:MAG TPA: crosslink repair DNA glycosylase YcaQ family protein [Myxococcales bacterium]|nr:crosslink repair DNA glycosylase YcaQ family protein [Myxococcales bacterium]